MNKFDIRNLTIEEKIGQMFMFAFHGTEINEQLISQVTELKVGGVIHFSRNIIDCQQVNKLNSDIQKIAHIPLFIGVDQEGGTVQRIIKDITPFPGAMSLSASQESPHQICKYVGEDLRSMNYNMVFAPVADVNNNPFNPVINSRSYGDDPYIVSRYVCEAYKGFQEALVLPTVKHFLGHGDTKVDSHVSLPTVQKVEKEIRDLELIPFKKAIEEGIDGVMSSHILYPAFDEKYPASLSKKIITNLLKEELHFPGIIVTDSLTMGAINNNFTKKEIITLAVNAGIDMMIFCGKADLKEQKELVEVFKQALDEGTIAIERVNESVAKILKYKEKYNVENLSERYISPNSEAINLGLKLSQKSITLVKDVHNLLPLNKENDNVLVIFPKIKLFSLVDNDNDKYTSLGSFLRSQDMNIDEVLIDEQNVDTIKTLDMKKYTKVIIATYNIQPDDYQTKVYNLLDRNKTIVISMRSPYDYRYLNDLQAYICIYEATDLAINSLGNALVGKIKFNGKLPIKID